MLKFLILYLVLSSLGWIWIYMGIATLRRCKKVREQERARTTAKVVNLIPEKQRIRHRNRHRIRTVWHPVVEFTVDGRRYRLQNPANLLQSEFSVGEDVEIIFDADDPSHFDFESVLEHDIRVAKIFIVGGLVWAVFFSPFLINKELNG